MQIEKNRVAVFHYRLSHIQAKDADKQELESSSTGEPMAALIGHGNILLGLEDALMGKQQGDSVEVTLPPERAYGLRREGAEQRAPIKHLLGHKPKQKLHKGMRVKVSTAEGAKDATVLKVGKFSVDLDTNHPLADQTLTFNIDIIEVREATGEELAHRHVHGLGGHHH